MSEATYEGTNLEAALQVAAEKIGATPEELDYEVLDEKMDFWGLEDPVVTIRAWPRAEEADEADEAAEEPEEQGVEAVEEGDAAPAEEPADESANGRAAGGLWGEEEVGESPAEARQGPPTAFEDEEVAEPPADEAREAAEAPEAEEAEEPVPSVAPDASFEATGEDPTEAIVALLEQTFEDMDFDCTVEVEQQTEGYLAVIGGADKDLLLESHGRCLSALELILNNVFRHKLPSGQKVRVDAGDFRSRREEELADLAYQVAHSAKESGKTQETQALNPYERRLVHLALAEDRDVTTRSRGSGFLKNVQIIPRRGNRGKTHRR